MTVSSTESKQCTQVLWSSKRDLWRAIRMDRATVSAPWFLPSLNLPGPVPGQCASLNKDLPFAQSTDTKLTSRQVCVMRLLRSIGYNFYVEVFGLGKTRLHCHDAELEVMSAFDLVSTPEGITVDNSDCPFFASVGQLIKYLVSLEGRALLGCSLVVPASDVSRSQMRTVRDTLRTLFLPKPMSNTQISKQTQSSRQHLSEFGNMMCHHDRLLPSS